MTDLTDLNAARVKINVAPQEPSRSPLPPSMPGGTSASAAPIKTAVERLLEIGPTAERLAAEARAEDLMFCEAHVNARAVVEQCSGCGCEFRLDQLTRAGRCHHICPACALERPEDRHYVAEEGMRKRAELTK